ncbi:MAG TPA: hypothetical protein VMW72_06015 [Sedimentisphaerales bacterium]|nr:hypothetical protein [Sedimentisphaerales bacterium]
MVPNNIICKRINAGAIMLVLFGLIAGLRADEITLLTPNQPPGATRVLSFPSGQCMGNLYLEPESGTDWDPKFVRLSGECEYLRPAQGDVLVPKDRNIKLWVPLALSTLESAKLLAQNPQAHQMTSADRIRKDPDDLSGLSELEPNDLFWLLVSTEMYLRTGANPRIFEPLSRLTGLQILSLQSAGITDEGLEHLRSLRSLRGLELTQASISNRGLAVLMDLPALEYLGLNTGVTDAGLKQVAQLSNLRWLRIADGKMWGPGLAELAKLPRLERLCIHGSSPISDRHIKYLEGLTQLKSLTLWGSACNTLTDASLASIGKLKNLEELHFIRTMPRFTVAGAAHLKNLKKIAFAQIMWSGYAGEYYGDEVVRQLAPNLPNLESLTGISYLTAEGMKTLAAFRNLKCLHVGLKNHILGYDGPTGVSHLAGLGSLEELNIYNQDSLSEADIVCLESLGRLKKLNVGSRHLTDRNLASFSKLDQLESLSLSVLGGADVSKISKSALNQLNGLSRLHTLQVNLWGNDAKTDPADELMLDLSGLKKMKDLTLSGLSLQDSDLAFLEHLPLLEILSIQPTQPDSPLTGAFLRHLRELPELNRLYVSGLSGCTGEDLAHLNGLPKLRSLIVAGDITDTALASLTGPLSLESLYFDTDEPIRKQTVADLAKSHPVIEYIHINRMPKVQTRPVSTPKRTGVSQPRTNWRAPANRRREKR